MLKETGEILEKIKIQFHKFKKEIKHKQKNKYASNDALLQLSSGAGGLDAKDWTEILLRMYLKFAEKENLKSEILSIAKNEEAGINSATIRFQGPDAYAKLYKENGVHRLVRLSPFNANNLRQTSFAKVEVIPQIENPPINLEDKDIKIDTFKAGGAGGQHVNTTDSAVRVTHLPTGLSVVCQNERSQLQNKETARKILLSKLIFQKEEELKQQEKKLKGEYKEPQWGNQIRSYVLHPYKMVKNHLNNEKINKVEEILNGNLNLIKR
ncbi:MAG: PCRF domain-containing protein [Candidatus Moranbacteria bacterium]|nr:PCRF domain-containing protein [Candidatus Moranbacteria bacterium]